MKLKLLIIVGAYTIIGIIGWQACRKPQEVDNDALSVYSAGRQTVFDDGSGAYGHMISGLSLREQEFHGLGDRFFGTPFLTVGNKHYPAGGLGPYYNQLSCGGCHVNDGRGTPPLSGQPLTSMFFKLALPGTDPLGFPRKVPGFGIQLQDKSISGYQPEGGISISYNDITFSFPDGEIAHLRQPNYSITNPYTALPSGTLLSPRVARPNYGIGIIERIAESSIIKNADPFDTNKDGISGEVNYVYDFVNQLPGAIGKIGWKASVANIKGQVVKALNEDIGIRTSWIPQENSYEQDFNTRMTGAEFPDSLVDALTFYIQTLSVPASRNPNDPQVKKGKNVFLNIGCAGCHVPSHTTMDDPSLKPLSGLRIFPWSDFLLHNMGPLLADGIEEFNASGSEWRTPPLWGIGLTQKISGHTNFLHDGRARNFQEAILWHGGEAQGAKDRYINLDVSERKALIRFLESL